MVNNNELILEIFNEDIFGALIKEMLAKINYHMPMHVAHALYDNHISSIKINLKSELK